MTKQSHLSSARVRQPWWLRLLRFGRKALPRRLPDERIYLAPF